MHCSLLVSLLRFFQASYLTTIMGHRDKKKKKNNANPENDPQEVRNDEKKNNANPENDPQEVRNDEATEQYVFQDKTCERFGTKLSANCPQVKPSISLT